MEFYDDHEEHLKLHREMRKLFIGEGHIDEVEFAMDPRERRMRLLFYRQYRRIVEKHELDQRAPWVRLREAMRGMQL